MMAEHCAVAARDDSRGQLAFEGEDARPDCIDTSMDPMQLSTA